MLFWLGLLVFFGSGGSKVLLPEVIVVKADHSDLNDSVFGNAKVIASNYADIKGTFTWSGDLGSC